MKKLKEEFLNRYNPKRTLEKALSSAISAAVQHNSLYKKEATLKEKESVHCKWMAFLKLKKKDYENEQPVEKYENDIQELRDLMNEVFSKSFLSEPHPKFKTEPGFRISHAQKSLSVFLKHLWCMGEVATPPQCPVDARILAIAGKKYPDTKWGYINSIDEHREKISFLETAKEESQSLAEWELELFKIEQVAEPYRR
jgi:hypothetical protein